MEWITYGKDKKLIFFFFWEKNLRTKQILENIFQNFFFKNATKHRKIFYSETNTPD